MYKPFYSDNMIIKVDKPFYYTKKKWGKKEENPIYYSTFKQYIHSMSPKISIEEKDNERIKKFRTDMISLIGKSFDKTPTEDDMILYVSHPLANVKLIPTEMLTDKVLLHVKVSDLEQIERYKFNHDNIKELIKLHGKFVIYFINMTDEMKKEFQ